MKKTRTRKNRDEYKSDAAADISFGFSCSAGKMKVLSADRAELRMRSNIQAVQFEEKRYKNFENGLMKGEEYQNFQIQLKKKIVIETAENGKEADFIENMNFKD